MKKQIFIFILFILLIGQFTFAQKDCYKVKRKVQQDFNKGNYFFHSLEFQPTENTFLSILNQDYNIHWLFITKDSLAYYKCYDSILSYHLEKKFGNNFLKIASKKADSLDKSIFWNKNPEFPGGKNAMYKYVYDRLKIDSENLRNRIQIKIILELTITKTGKLEDIEVKKGISGKFDKKIVQIFSEMPNWTPAYLHNKPSKQRFIYPIQLDYRLEQKHQKK